MNVKDFSSNYFSTKYNPRLELISFYKSFQIPSNNPLRKKLSISKIHSSSSAIMNFPKQLRKNTKSTNSVFLRKSKYYGSSVNNERCGKYKLF